MLAPGLAAVAVVFPTTSCQSSVGQPNSTNNFQARSEDLPVAAVSKGRVYPGESWRNYAERTAVDPYAHGPQLEVLRGFGGEVYQFQRCGPHRHQMQISICCWSNSRHPAWCCPGSCWTARSIRDYCCKKGVSADGTPDRVFHNLTRHLMAYVLDAFFERFLG